MNKKKSREEAYSLIEILFVVAIFSLVALGITYISNFSWKSYTYSKERSIMQKNRRAIQQIINQTRNALEIKINQGGQRMSLKKDTASSHQSQYYHYILKDNNLYLKISPLPTLKQNRDLNSSYKSIIDGDIINNQRIFSLTSNKLVKLSFEFRKEIKEQGEKINLQQNVYRRIYPRNQNINLSWKEKAREENDRE